MFWEAPLPGPTPITSRHRRFRRPLPTISSAVWKPPPKNPWEKAEGKIKKGKTIEGKITSITPYGAFVEVMKNVEGMVHISNLGSKITDPNKVLEKDKKYKFEILDLDLKDKKISLKLIKLAKKNKTIKTQKKDVKTKAKTLKSKSKNKK